MVDRGLCICRTLSSVNVYFVFGDNYICDTLVRLSVATSQQGSGNTVVYIINRHSQHTSEYRTYRRTTWGLRSCLFHILHCVETNKFA